MLRGITGIADGTGYWIVGVGIGLPVTTTLSRMFRPSWTQEWRLATYAAARRIGNQMIDLAPPPGCAAPPADPLSNP
jgi:hypothetical protein